jgi:hypothetical protein
MARPILPDDPDPGSGGDPGTPGEPMPRVKLAFALSGTGLTITADQIMAAGGPWPSFSVRVTPRNANGNGTPAEVDYPAP